MPIIDREWRTPTSKKRVSGRFHFCMPVWGLRYINIFLQAGLPTQLSEGNLGKFPWLASSTYEIYTTHRDKVALEQHPTFRALSRLVRVSFKFIDRFTLRGKWKAFRTCQQMAVRSADANEAALFFLCPDQIWADGSFSNAASHIMDGRSAVLCPGPRAIEEAMLPLLELHRDPVTGASMRLSAQTLVRLGLSNLHPDTKTWFWDNPDYFRVPPYIFFDVPDEGALVFCYIPHPVVINAEVRNAPFRWIFDQDYLEAACPNLDKIHVVQSSEEAFHFELSPWAAHVHKTIDREGSGIEIQTWNGEWSFLPHHRAFATHPIRLTTRRCSEAVWRAVEQRGEDIIEQISEGWRFSDDKLLQTRPGNLIRRIRARSRFAKAMPEADRALLLKAERAEQAGVDECSES